MEASGSLSWPLSPLVLVVCSVETTHFFQPSEDRHCCKRHYPVIFSNLPPLVSEAQCS